MFSSQCLSGQSLVIVYMECPEMKITADVISLWSLWQKWNYRKTFTSDKDKEPKPWESQCMFIVSF